MVILIIVGIRFLVLIFHINKFFLAWISYINSQLIVFDHLILLKMDVILILK